MESTCSLGKSAHGGMEKLGKTELLSGGAKVRDGRRLRDDERIACRLADLLFVHGGETDETRYDPGPSAACLLAMLQMRNVLAWVRSYRTNWWANG